MPQSPDAFDPNAYLNADGSPKPPSAPDDFDPEKYLGGGTAMAVPSDDSIGASLPSGALGQKVAGGFIQDTLEAAPKVGIMAGRSIPIVGSIGKHAGAAIGAVLSAPFSDKTIQELYSDAIDAAGAEEKEFAEKHPVGSGLAGFLGAAAIPMPTFAGAGAKVATGAAKALGGSKVAETIGKGLGDVTARGGRVTGNALLSYLDAKARGLDEGKAREAMGTAGMVAGGFEALGAAGKAAKAFIPRYMFGVTPRMRERYAARPGEINAISEESAKMDLDVAVDSLKSKVDEAQRVFDESTNAAREARAVERYAIGQEIQTARTAYETAQEQARQAGRVLTEQLKSQKAPELTDDILSAVKNLRDANSKASSEAFAMLPADQAVNMAPIKGLLTQRINNLKIAGQVPPGQTGADIGQLQEVREFLDALPAQMLPADVKQLIQSVDNQIGAVWAKARGGGYVSQGDRALMEFRRDLDGAIKEMSPAYAEAMKKLSAQTGTYKQAEDLFLSPENIRRELTAIGAGRAPESAEALKGLGAATGQDFEAPLAAFTEAQTTLRTPGALRQKIEALPENERAKAFYDWYLTEKQKLTHPGFVSERLSQLPEVQAAESAGQSLETAKAWAEPVRGLSPANTQAAMRRAGSEAGTNLELRKTLGYLSEIAGKDFTAMADDLAVKRAFEQGFTRGSRNVNLSAASIGGLLGSVNQKLFGVGGFIGGVGGAIADVSGPAAYKFLADLSNRPTLKALASVAEQALMRGPQAFMAANYLLALRNPEYAQFLQDQAGGAAP